MEREILFCITAVQMGVAELSVLMEIGNDLSQKKIRSVRAELIRRASIGWDKVKTIEQAVDITASAYKYNYKSIISNEIIKRLIREAFGGSIDIGPDGGISPSSPRTNVRESNVDIHRVTEEATGRYEKIKEVGSGGIGKVILSLDRHIGRNIAIKELLTVAKTSTGNDDRLSIDEARFLREARLTANLEHPSIVPVYEIGRRQNGTFYYSMKYVRGRTLSEEIKNCRSIGERLRYLNHFVGLCNAIAYAHSKGVIHRDIKPHNVMVGEFGETVVLDWGLARIKDRVESENEKFAYQMKLLKDAAAGRTVSGEVMGTPQYMSPEQAWGDVENIDERSDIYSLGAVLYEILTGFPPFEGDSALEIVNLVRAYLRGEQRLTPVKEEEPECPEELAAIAEKALSAKKENRYHSVVDLVDDVEAYMAGRKVMSHRYSMLANLRHIFRRGKGVDVAVLISLGLSVVSLFFIGFFYNLYKDARYQRYVDKSLATLSGSDYIAASYYAASAHRVSSSDRRILHLITYPFSTPPYNATIAEGQKITAMDISPDNKYLVVGTDGGVINLYNYLSFDLISSVRTELQTRAIIFLPDSERVAIGFADGTVMIYNVNPFALTKIIKDFGSPIGGITFSEGGRYLAIAAGFRYSGESYCSDCAIKLYSVGDYKKLMELRSHSRLVNGLLFTHSNKYLVSTSYDGSIIFWDIFSKKEVKRVPLLSPVVDIALFLRDSVLTLTEDGRLISYNRGGESSILPAMSERHHLLRVIPDKDVIITAGGVYEEGGLRDANIRIFRDRKLYNIISGFKYRITAIAITDDGRFLTVSDENGGIYTFRSNQEGREDDGLQFNPGLKDRIYGFRCIQKKDICIGIDREFNLLKITKEKNLISNIAQQIGRIDIRGIYPLSEERMLVDYAAGGLSIIDLLRGEVLPLSSAINIEHIESTLDNEYIGIQDGSMELHLYQHRDDGITDTGYSKKNVRRFSFSPDGRYIVYSRTDRLPSMQKITNLFIDELLTDSQEMPLYRSPVEDISCLFVMDDPFRVAFLDIANNLYIINRAGQLLNKTLIDNSAKIKDIIPIAKTPYLLVRYENKKYIGLFDIDLGKLSFFLFGHTDNIIKADVLENRVVSVSQDGTVITYDIPKVIQWLSNIRKEEIEKRFKTYQHLLNKMGLFYP